MRKIFIVGYVWPEPTASAAGIRMLQLIRFFREQDYQVHFGTPAQKPEHTFDLHKMGVITHEIRVNDEGFDRLLLDICPDLVLFDRFMMEEQFSWRVAENLPQALRILDTEDLHFLRKYRQKSAFEATAPQPEEILNDPLAKREIAAIYRCDLSLIISEYEMELLFTTFGVPPGLLVYHPLFADDQLKRNRDILPGFDGRRDMVFIGNFLHEPNTDAIRALEEGLWQEIRRKLPGVQLHIYGAYMPESFKRYSPLLKHDTIFHGRAENVDTVMQKARLCIAPLRFGAGLKGKLIRAMENRLPSVTTPVGAEGIAGDMPWGGLIRPLGTPFTDAVKKLYTEREQWDIAADHGFDIVDKRFMRSDFEKVLLGRINACMLDIRACRSGNFTGQMLMDQRNMAARYLSKYIMAKNANSR